jgi:bacterioferritin-associated ferredoxin
MIVCVCRRISDRDIERAAREGCGTFEDLQIDLGVAVCCGRCADCARDVLNAAQAQPCGGHHRISAATRAAA